MNTKPEILLHNIATRPEAAADVDDLIALAQRDKKILALVDSLLPAMLAAPQVDVAITQHEAMIGGRLH